MTPTPEQHAIVAAARSSDDNLMIQAYAGCAKTTTLTLMAREIAAPGLALAFNVKIKKELEKKFPSNFSVLTLNGLGHRAWAKALGKFPEISEYKLGKIVTEVIRPYSDLQDQWGSIRTLASNAMTIGIVPAKFSQKGLVSDTHQNWLDLCEDAEPPTGVIDLAREALIQSIDQSMGLNIKTPLISFDDQIYMSTLFGGDYIRYPVVMVDEAQDLSPLNHIQIKRSAAGRLIVVGDSCQAIYGFRGADHESMTRLRSLRSKWVDLPLTTTFRCPQAVVKRQQEHAPGFTAAPSAPFGEVKRWEEWTSDDLLAELSPKDSCAIICRNNAPLLRIALEFLTRGIGVVILGRDLGKNLLNLIKKICPDDDATESMVRHAINSWRADETSKAELAGTLAKIQGIVDKAMCLEALLGNSQVTTAGELRTTIKRIFDQERGRITLSTGHGAKGLEWDVVMHLDPWRIPSKFARRAAANGDIYQLIQENNLKYVIETRTKRCLILANSFDFLREDGEPSISTHDETEED